MLQMFFSSQLRLNTYCSQPKSSLYAESTVPNHNKKEIKISNNKHPISSVILTMSINITQYDVMLHKCEHIQLCGMNNVDVFSFRRIKAIALHF